MANSDSFSDVNNVRPVPKLSTLDFIVKSNTEDAKQQAATCGYNLRSERGVGTFGVVYEATNNKDEPFAYKYLPFDENTYEKYGMLDLIEIDIMSRVNHPNIMHATHIVTPYNCRINGVAIVMPLAEKSLWDIIKEKVFQNTLERLQIIYSLACGLQFLHANKILHLDIKVLNVMLKGSPADNNVSWIDFGLASIVDDITVGKISRGQKISLDSRPPEILRGNNTYNAACDVWSFAMLMLYTLSERDIWNVDYDKIFSGTPEERSQKEIGLAKHIESKLQDNNFMPHTLRHLPDTYRQNAIDLLSQCLHLDPAKRPSLKEICSHQLFKDFKPIGQGSLLETPILITEYSKDHREILKLMLNWCQEIYANESCEILFMAVDLYNRCIYHFKTRKEEFRMSIAAACLWMADKLIRETRAILLQKYTPFIRKAVATITDKAIRDCELEIIHVLHGILSVNKLYRVCHNLEHLRICFDEIIMSKDSTLYAQVDIVAMENLLAKYPSDVALPITITQLLT